MVAASGRGRARSASRWSRSSCRSTRRSRARPDLLGAPGPRSATSGSPTSRRACSRWPRTPAGCSPSAPGCRWPSTTPASGSPAGSTVLADTVTRGAPVTAVIGTLDEVNGHPREEVTGTLMHVRIDAVRRVKDTVALQRGRARRHDAACRCASTSSRSTAGSGWMPRCPAPTPSPSTSTGGPRPRGIAPALPEQNLRERRLLGRPHRRRAARLHLGARHRRLDRRRCRCPAPSTCARTAGSPCTCGLRGPWSPSRTPLATP